MKLSNRLGALDEATLLLTAFFLFQFTVCHAAHVFDTFRLVQYDKGSQQFGSRRASLNLVASVLPKLKNVETVSETFEKSNVEKQNILKEERGNGEDMDFEEEYPDDFEEEEKDTPEPEIPKPKRKSKGSSGKDMARKVVVIRITELTTAKLDEIVHKRGAFAILILLIPDISKIPKQEIARWKELEQYCFKETFQIPIYFSFSDQVLDEMYQILNVPSLQDSVVDRHQLVVTTTEPNVISSPSAFNFQGWHRSASHTNTKPEGPPTIAIVANYDTFGAAPDLSFGVDHNGSGAITLLEIARIFSRLYSEFRTQGRYNLLFVLTGGGRMNFAGAKHWLRTVDTRVLESLEFALCLEAISDSSKLYLHVSRISKLDHIQRLYDNFRVTAKKMGIEFEIVHKKINISSPHVNWQHEQFSRKRVVASTLSSHPFPSPRFTASSIFDTRESVNITALKKNIKFIVEVLSKHIYGFKGRDLNDLEVVRDSRAVNSNFVDAWFNFVSTQPRMSAHMTKDSKVIVQFENAMSKYTSDAKKIAFNLDNTYKFYDITSEKMHLYKVKPFTFHVVMFFSIAAYLSILHLYFKAPENMNEWRKLFTKLTTWKSRKTKKHK